MDVNCLLENGDSPLHYCARYNFDPKNIELLCAKGAKVNHKNNQS